MKLVNRPHSRRSVAKILVVAAIVLLAVSGWSWWHFVRSEPENVFWSMMNNSLGTRSVTHTSVQQSDAQQATQIVRLQTAPTNITVGQSTIVQQASGSTTKVTTQTIGTPFEDYVRYTNISGGQKNSKGQLPNYASVTNVWGKSTNPDSKQTAGQLYGQSVLGVIPFANLPAPYRTQVINQMKKDGSYSIDWSKVKRQTQGKRPVYSYNVTIKPVPYVTALKQVATLSGLNQLESVNPDDYKTTPDAQFVIQVDVWSQQVISVTQPGSSSVDLFGSYGLTTLNTDLPGKTTTIDDLQTKLQTIQ